MSELDLWPPLSLAEWQETYATLHMWTQVVGKIRLALTPRLNHWWNVPLYVTARGLTTSAMPLNGRKLEIEFDFIDHNLLIRSSDDQAKALPLISRSVSAFYEELMQSLRAIEVDVQLYTTPVEVPSPIPFERDQQHHTYRAEQAQRLWRILCTVDSIFNEFRGRFIGKCSPVHFFWGSFDLAVTRFSGRRAPLREGADPVTQEAYSHEVISHGFWPGGAWPGGGGASEALFYSYTAPEPPGLAKAKIAGKGSYDAGLKEFVLPYDAVRGAQEPAAALLEFMQSTYEVGADLAGWDRRNLERSA